MTVSAALGITASPERPTRKGGPRVGPESLTNCSGHSPSQGGSCGGTGPEGPTMRSLSVFIIALAMFLNIMAPLILLALILYLEHQAGR